LDLDATGGTSGHGDASESRVRVLGGRNLADGRANIEVNAEFLKSDGLIGSQRHRFAQDLAFVTPSGPSPYITVLAANQRQGCISTGGVPLTDDGDLNVNPQFGIRSPSGQTLAFTNGRLAPYNVGPVDGSLTSNTGGDGLDPSRYQSLLTPQRRINGTALGSLRINDRVRLFGEFWYSHTFVQQEVGFRAYSGLSGQPAGMPYGNPIIAADNPFLSSADRATIANNLAAYAAIPRQSDPDKPVLSDAFQRGRGERRLPGRSDDPTGCRRTRW